MADEPKAKSPIPDALSVAIVLGFFAFVFVPSTGAWKIEDSRFNVVWPQLVALVSAVIGYQLGSSKQTERQTEMLNKAIPPAEAPPPGTTVTTKTTVAPAVLPPREVFTPEEREAHLATLAEERAARLNPHGTA